MSDLMSETKLNFLTAAPFAHQFYKSISAAASIVHAIAMQINIIHYKTINLVSELYKHNFVPFDLFQFPILEVHPIQPIMHPRQYRQDQLLVKGLERKFQ